MGADSLVTLVKPDGNVSSMVPYYNKLFPIGNMNSDTDNYAAGAMLNGAGSIGGRTVEDIIYDFSEEYPKVQPTQNYSLEKMAIALGKKVQDIINSTISKNPMLEIIIGGYSEEKGQAEEDMEKYIAYFGRKNPID